MARMRTVGKAIQYLKSKDPDCAVSEWWIRKLLKENKIKYHRAGNKYLINIDYLIEYLKNPPLEEKEPIIECGKLRKLY